MKALMFTAIAGLFAAACGSSETTTAVPLEQAQVGMTGEESEIVVALHGRVAEECDLRDDRAHFQYNSAAVQPNEAQALRDIASCLRDGELRDEKIVIAGYTDPRGTELHNEQLGLERAQNVARFLVSYGVPSDRIFVKSYGASKVSYELRQKMEREREAKRVDARDHGERNDMSHMDRDTQRYREAQLEDEMRRQQLNQPTYRPTSYEREAYRDNRMYRQTRFEGDAQRDLWERERRVEIYIADPNEQ